MAHPRSVQRAESLQRSCRHGAVPDLWLTDAWMNAHGRWAAGARQRLGGGESAARWLDAVHFCPVSRQISIYVAQLGASEGSPRSPAISVWAAAAQQDLQLHHSHFRRDQRRERSLIRNCNQDCESVSTRTTVTANRGTGF
jgi:hypothetical protein